VQTVDVEEERGGKSITWVSYHSLITELCENMSISRLRKLEL